MPVAADFFSTAAFGHLPLERSALSSLSGSEKSLLKFAQPVSVMIVTEEGLFWPHAPGGFGNRGLTNVSFARSLSLIHHLVTGGIGDVGFDNAYERQSDCH